jgi:two-component system alkaline phosphatase synthesis response regulator PhoP
MSSKEMNEDELNPILQKGAVKTIAVVDDEDDILELLKVNLKKAGYKVKTFSEADPFLEYLKSNMPDLVVLDLMLPDADGFEICKYIRKNEKLAAMPVIMLTARGDEMDRVLGLELGADDYITKPFSPRELVARVKAVLRREEKSIKTKKIKIGDDLEIDLQKYETYVSGEKVELTSTEFQNIKTII